MSAVEQGNTCMGDVVIVAYRPKSGQDEALLTLVADHVPFGIGD